MKDFLSLKFAAIWSFFKGEHYSFWAVCGYLFFEYVRPQSIYPTIDIIPWGKIFVVIAIIGWFLEKGSKWCSTPANKWMIIYLFVVTLSSFFAHKPEISWFYFMNYFNWFLIFFLVINVVNTEKRLFIFLLIFLVASYKMSFHGARTWAFRGFAFTSWGLQGPKGPFENSGEFAVQMLMLFPISYRLAVSIKPLVSKKMYLFLIGAPITAVLTILGASSRGSQVGLIFQLYHTFLRGKLSIKSVSVVLIVVAGVFFLLPEEQLNRFRSAGKDGTSNQRLIYWERGVEMIQDHPVLGVGYYNFAAYFDDYYSADISGKSELPHNIFIQVGTDAGFTGLFVYLSMIFCCFRMSRDIRARLSGDQGHWLYGLSYGYDAALVGFLIAGQFVTIGYYPFFWVHLAFVAATRSIVVNFTKNSEGSSTPRRQALAKVER